MSVCRIRDIFSLCNVQTSRRRAGGPQTRATRHTLTMHVTKCVLVMLLASRALAAETAHAGIDRADAAYQTARATITRLEHQLKGLNLRATRSARAV